jgi:hypothetical protein
VQFSQAVYTRTTASAFAQPLKTFSVILTNTRGGATLGPQSTSEVRITDTR